MKRIWMSGAAMLMAVSVAGLNAQSTGSQTPQTPAPQTPAATASDVQATTTLRGCVYKEEAVPGRAPNVAERAGVMEDYIFVASNASAMAGTSGAATGATPPATTPPTTPPSTPPATPPATAGTTGAAPAMAHAGKAFKLEKASDDQLKTLVGKMVEVTGKMDADNDTTPTGTSGAPAADRVPGNPDRIELDEFEVTSIREVEGTCPATPNIKK